MDEAVRKQNIENNSSIASDGLSGYLSQHNSSSGAIVTSSLLADKGAKIPRKQRIIAKLDAERLLGPMGLPYIRKMAKNLSFKGQGHEVLVQLIFY